MRFLTIVVAGLSLVLIALTLVPSAGSYRPLLAAGALICAVIVLVTVGFGWPTTQTRVTSGSNARSASTTAIAAAPVAAREAEIVGLLAILQDKGRLVDFLQDDISGYTDAQVGAAARVVHQGCKAVLHEYFQIVPVREENEGSRVTVAGGLRPRRIPAGRKN